MTNAQIARKAESLHRKAQSAFNTYSRARGRRRDKGARIQSAAEIAANRRANIAAGEHRAFCEEHGIAVAPINY